MTTKNTPFQIGADPEFFIKKGSRFIAAEDVNGPIIPGTKKKPYPVKDGAIQVDGLACEFNVKPSTTEDEFFNSVKNVCLDIKKRLQSKDPDFQMAAVSFATFGNVYFKRLPDHVKILGCEPDLNAYTMEYNPPPKANGSFRTAGGHAHFSWCKGKDPHDPSHLLDCQMVVKEAERYIGPLLRAWEGPSKREKLYGAAGAFRPKPYGVEWRSPSNVWLKNEFKVRTMFSLCMGLLQSLDSGRHNFNFSYRDKKDILERGPHVL